MGQRVSREIEMTKNPLKTAIANPGATPGCPAGYVDVAKLVYALWGHGSDDNLGFPNLERYARYMVVAKAIKYLDGDVTLCVQIILTGLAGSNPAIHAGVPPYTRRRLPRGESASRPAAPSMALPGLSASAETRIRVSSPGGAPKGIRND